METDDSGTAMTTFLEKAEIWMKNSNEDVSFVILCSSNKTGALIESAYSSDMKEFVEDEEVLTKFRNACAKTSEVEKSLKLKKAKKLKDELPQMYHDVHYKHAVGQKHGAVDKIPVKKHCSPRKENRSYADAVKKHESSESPSLSLPPELLETNSITTNDYTSEMFLEVSSMRLNSIKLLDTKEAVVTISIGPATYPDGCMAKEMPGEPRAPSAESLHEWSNEKKLRFIQLETNSTDEVPTATTNSTTTNDSTLEVFLTEEVSSVRLPGTEPWDAKEVVVNLTSPTCRSIGVQTEIPISIGPATYPDGCMAKEMPGEPRAPSAESLHEWSNEKKLRFIQDVNGWKDESASKYRIFVRDLEKGGAKIVKDNWTRRISEKILKAMQRPYVWYDGSSVKDLLRFIRNVHIHYHQLSEDVKTSLGKPRDKVIDYFTVRFPMLLDHTYSVVEQFSKEDDFRPYY